MGEGLVKIFFGDLEFEKSVIDFVDDDNGFDVFIESLVEYSFGLDVYIFDGVDDDESIIGDMESGSDFGREINVIG